MKTYLWKPNCPSTFHRKTKQLKTPKNQQNQKGSSASTTQPPPHSPLPESGGRRRRAYLWARVGPLSIVGFAARSLGEPAVSRTSRHRAESVLLNKPRPPSPGPSQNALFFEPQLQHAVFHATNVKSTKIDTKRNWLGNNDMQISIKKVILLRLTNGIFAIVHQRQLNMKNAPKWIPK